MYSCAFAGTPPDAVKKAFAKKFPTATQVSWGKESAKEWEADFIFEGSKISANFLQDGTWDWKIVEADLTETAKNGTIYEVDLKKGLKSKSLAFKENGTIIIE